MIEMLLPSNWTHAGIFGSTGTGKTMLAELICEIEYINNGKKIIDLTNNRYIEAVSFMRPTRIPKFRRNLAITRSKCNEKSQRFLIPRAFPTEIYHPIIGDLPKKLPPNIKLYTLPVDFFAYEDVLRVLTNDSLGDAAYVSLTQQIEKIKRDESFSMIPVKIIESLEQKTLKTMGFRDTPMYFFFDPSSSASSANRPLLKMKNLGVISSQNFPLVLDNQKMRNILLDRNTITAFTTRFIDQRYNKIKLAINLYLLNKIREISKGVGRTIVYIREARELFPNPRFTDKALKVLAEQAESMAKDCRKAGIQLLLDTQQTNDLPDGVLDQIKLKFIFRHGNRESDIMEMFRGSPSLDNSRVKHIRRLRDFRYYISSAFVSISVNPYPGRTMYFKLSDHLEQDEDELGYISKVVPKSEWFDTAPKIDALADDWKQTSDKISGKFDFRRMKEKEVAVAKSIGITSSEMRVFGYLHEQGGRTSRLKDIQIGASLAKSTAKDALDKMINNGFAICKEEDGISAYCLTEKGLKFVEENNDVFD